MRVLKTKSSRAYAEDPAQYFGFERFEADCGDFVLIEVGFDELRGKWDQFALGDEELARVRKQRLVRLEFEEPNNFFTGEDKESYDWEFEKIFTICPYTADWLNKRSGVERRVPIFFPFNAEHMPPAKSKEYDVIYTGHIVSKHLLADIRTMSAFNYRLVSHQSHPLVTNQGASYFDKLDLIARTRIALVHNLLYLDGGHMRKLRAYDRWWECGAFSAVPRKAEWWRRLVGRNRWLRDAFVPQLKSRLFEAAFCRSLILCRRDGFNVIERYFEPDRDFVYYEAGDLHRTIAKILANFGKYERMIENAHEKAVENYTTAKFVERFLKPLGSTEQAQFALRSDPD